MAQIVFLHGASSSGKSTIAKALQASIEKPFWHISIDHLRDSGVLPLSRFRSGEFAWSTARKAFFDGFHASLAAYADAGNDLMTGGIGNDIMTGGLGDDSMEGGDGNDRLWGMEGNDTIHGGAGDDILVGGLGVDILDAGTGINQTFQ